MDYTKIKSRLEDTLSDEKYHHSLATAQNAKKLCEITGYKDIEKAYLAALLHDCAKCINKIELKKIADGLDFVSDEEKEMPKTLHAPVGAYIAKKDFGIEDEEILSAIRFHTVAHPNMTHLEMIVFLADKIREEFGIKYFGADAFDFVEIAGIEKAMIKSIENGIEHLKNKGAKPCSLTLCALDWFKNKVEIKS